MASSRHNHRNGAGPVARALLALVACLQLAGGLVVPVAVTGPADRAAAKVCPCAPEDRPVPCCCGTSCCSTTDDGGDPQPQPAKEEQQPRLILVPALAVKACHAGDGGVSASADSGPLFIEATSQLILASAPVTQASARSTLPVSRSDSPASPPPRS
ncbi:MAG: hypothetical protein ACKO9Z_08095 [Planctomycetota bacterium]